MTAVLDLIARLPAWSAYGLIGLIVLAEAGAFVGIVLPGETALLIGGALASTGHLTLPVILAVGAVAAVVGDSIGYEVGRLSGGRLRTARVGRLVGAARWQRAEDVVSRRGGSAVAAGRWVGVARALVPALAGITRMPYRTFLLWNAAGGITWAVVVVLAGYAAGTAWQPVAGLIGRAGAVLAVVVVISALLALAGRWLRRHPDQIRGAGRWVAGLVPVRVLPGALGWIVRRGNPCTTAGAVRTAGPAVLASLAGSLGLYDAAQDGTGVDRSVHDWLAGHRDPALTTAMRLITDLGGTPVLVTVAVVVGCLAGRRVRSWRPVLLVAATGLGSLVITVVGKAATHRDRPALTDAVSAAGGYSFPSGHALNSAAVYGIATVLTWQLARHRWTKLCTVAGAVLLVLLIGLSRLYLGVHWLTDVLAAYMLTLGWLTVTVTAANALARPPDSRRVPSVDLPNPSDLSPAVRRPAEVQV